MSDLCPQNAAAFPAQDQGLNRLSWRCILLFLLLPIYWAAEHEPQDQHRDPQQLFYPVASRSDVRQLLWTDPDGRVMVHGYLNSMPICGDEHW